MSSGELCTTCQSLLFLTWTSCLWLSWRNVFTCRTGLCFLFGRGLSLPLWVSLHFFQYLLACFWIRADLINSSFPCPSLQALPPWPGAVLCSQHSPQPSCCPFPAFQTFAWGHVRGQRDRIPEFLLLRGQARSLSVSTKPFASYHTMTCWVFFLIKNKFGFWFTNHEFFPHRAHQRPVKLLAFPSVYKAILYYKELIFLSHAWLFWFFFKTCTLNISNLIFSYELTLSAHNWSLEKEMTGPVLSKIIPSDAWSSNTC